MWILHMLMGLLALNAWNYQHVTEAVNIETKHYTTYREEEGSMFGFSITEYRDYRSYGWVIVGAPEAQTSQRDVYRGGAVYKCDIMADNRCVQIDFDRSGNNYNTNPYVQIDNKTLQWFGATVSSSHKDGGPLLACAPRYIWFSRKITMREPVGTCWITNFTNSFEYSPCRTSHWGYHRQGSCQAGLGAAVSKDGDRLFIGAPGSWFWQGQVFSQSAVDKSRVMFTKEGLDQEDDSYMGYSVATGDFIGNGKSGIAVGMPRGVYLKGKVLLFTSTMVNHQNITGEQMGAYFGYAVASGDINGDGLDDVIIGAPMYTVPNNPEKSFETGRVYVYYQGRDSSNFQINDHRDGLIHRGRFGLSLASLGDINRDGYGDFAVGEPYGGSEGRGAVYIYHGSSEGVLEKSSQVIDAANLETPIQTFGFSIAGGHDLDQNGYPDLAVGAYESNTAMFFRSRPIIKMNSYVVFELDSKVIDLDIRTCTLSNLVEVTCLPLKACLTYSGDGVLPRHEFDVQYVLDVKKPKAPRMFFLDHEENSTMSSTILAERNVEYCRTVKVYVSSEIRDKLTPFDAEMRMSLKEDHLYDYSPRNPRTPLRPVLGSTTSRKDTFSIRKNCGSNNICVPDLQLTVKPNVDKYHVGSGKRLNLTVLVQNIGEDAFEAMFYLKLPPGINYVNTEQAKMSEIVVQCSLRTQSKNNVLRCDIGNPFPGNKSIKFDVILQPTTSDEMEATYELEMNVNTTNPEKDTMSDNRQYLSLPIWVETVLDIVGESRPKNLYYNPDNFTAENITTELEFGPAFTHNYTISNRGPNRILKAEVYLVWPAKTIADEELLYLLEQPEVSKPITCESANANYLSLRLDERRESHMRSGNLAGVNHQESSSKKTINVQREYELTDAERRKLEREMSEANTDVGSEIHRTQQKINTVNTETRWKQHQESDGAMSGSGSFDNRDQFHTNVQKTSEITGNLSGQGSRVQSNANTGFQHQWDTEETIGGSDLSLMNNSEDLKQFFSKLGNDDSAYDIYNEDGKQFVMFKGRFRAAADGKEYIEFKDGNILELMNEYGKPSYTSSDQSVQHQSNFLRLEGQLITGHDGKHYIQLKDGKMIPLKTSYTYTERRTYSTDGEPRESSRTYSSGGQRYHEVAQEADNAGRTYGNSWHEKSSSRDNKEGGAFEIYRSQTHEEKHSSEKKYNTRVYGRDSDVNVPAGDNVPTNRPDQRRNYRYRRESDVMSVEEFRRYEKRQHHHHHHRHRREDNFDQIPDYAKDIDADIQFPQCTAAKCIVLHCSIESLNKDEEAWISTRYRVKASTLKKFAFNEQVEVSTKLIAQVTKQPYIGAPRDRVVYSSEVTTSLQPTALPLAPDVVPLWVVVLSACAGTIILLLLIYLLYKCGFFKRNRPSDVPERQPLNRNGHF
ncbi:integrin alpha-PS2 isoform X2 [Cephus cinctus]|uniref:Integrin alpha-PS2 isoform X2 n=1 Tax=Cephus cinctus TaxID=211228 RepID=A0AAJ7FRV2_CEPCN|nr:integrin alpha-PS2 isoform X2 [Cephus cinctus]